MEIPCILVVLSAASFTSVASDMEPAVLRLLNTFALCLMGSIFGAGGDGGKCDCGAVGVSSTSLPLCASMSLIVVVSSCWTTWWKFILARFHAWTWTPSFGEGNPVKRLRKFILARFHAWTWTPSFGRDP